MARVLIFIIGSGLAIAGSAHAANSLFGGVIDTQVNVVVNLGGKESARPSPTAAQPAFYQLVSGGFVESGAITAREKALSFSDVAQPLSQSLALQHYLATTTKNPQPSLLFVVHWGYINPQIDRDAGIFYSQTDMLSLIGGKSLGNVTNVIDQKDLVLASEESRYFVILSAYDYKDAQSKKKTLLWRAKMSAPSVGAEPGSMIPALIASGAPHFGHETTTPVVVNTQVVKSGHVEIGAPKVVPDLPNPPNSAPQK